MSINTFRRADESDADTIAQLVNAAYRPGVGATSWTHESELVDGDRTTAQHVSELLRKPNAIVMLGLIENEIVACALIEKADKICHIGMLAVRPVLQASGVGKLMLAEAERYAISHLAAETLQLTVVSARSELIAFYQRRGYQSTGEFKDYPHISGVGRPRLSGLKLAVLEKRSD